MIFGRESLGVDLFFDEGVGADLFFDDDGRGTVLLFDDDGRGTVLFFADDDGVADFAMPGLDGTDFGWAGLAGGRMISSRSQSDSTSSVEWRISSMLDPPDEGCAPSGLNRAELRSDSAPGVDRAGLRSDSAPGVDRAGLRSDSPSRFLIRGRGGGSPFFSGMTSGPSLPLH